MHITDIYYECIYLGGLISCTCLDTALWLLTKGKGQCFVQVLAFIVNVKESSINVEEQEFRSLRKARLSTERWIEIVFCALNDVRHATDQKKLGIAEGGFSLLAIRWLHFQLLQGQGTPARTRRGETAIAESMAWQHPAV